jgi:hypothetical protein
VQCGAGGCASAPYFTFTAPFGLPSTSNITSPPADGTCSCWRYFNPTPMTAITSVIQRHTVQDTDDTVQCAAFSDDGQTKFVQGTVNVAAAAGAPTITNSATARIYPVGFYWYCISDGQGGGSSAWNLARSTGSGEFRTQKLTGLSCPAGVIPATITTTGSSIVTEGVPAPTFQGY